MRRSIAFSSEVETSSREENASKQETGAPIRRRRIGKGSSLRLAAAAIFAAGFACSAGAEDEATFRIEFNDGQVTPQRLEVPANRRLELELVNSGKSPAEFESRELRKEKVLAPGASSVLVIRALDPGEYDFFDDFHPDAKPAVLVAK